MTLRAQDDFCHEKMTPVLMKKKYFFKKNIHRGQVDRKSSWIEVHVYDVETAAHSQVVFFRKDVHTVIFQRSKKNVEKKKIVTFFEKKRAQNTL